MLDASARVEMNSTASFLCPTRTLRMAAHLKGLE
jgi:hypothetical protein